MQEKEKYSDKELFEEINRESSRVTSEDISKIVSKEKQFKRKSASLDIYRFWKLFKQLKVGFLMIKDYKNKEYTDIPWKSMTLIIAAILYFLNPFDLIPDFIPVIGFTDDAAAVAIVFASLRKDIIKYCNWKGIPKEDIF